MLSDPRFATIRGQMLTFEGGLKSFYSDMKSRVAMLLPALKAGDADESDLVTQVINPYNSGFYYYRCIIHKRDISVNIHQSFPP